MNRTDDTNAVKAVIANYIKGTANSDPDLLRSVFHKNAVMSGYLGLDMLLGNPEPFFQTIAQKKVGPDYEGEIVQISVTGRTAMASVVEDNLYDLSFVNTFHLLNLDGVWKITSKLFHHD